MLYVQGMDVYACGHYRCYWPAAMIGEGIHLGYPDDVGDDGIRARIHPVTRTVIDVTIPTDCDAVLVQRPTSIMLLDTIKALKRAGIRIIVEIDDDLAALSPRHPSWALLRMPGHSPTAFIEAAKIADRVVCSSAALLERYGGDHGVLVPNFLPPHFYGLEKSEDATPHVGWPGSVGTHPDDLAVMGNALTRLKVPMKIVGPPPRTGRTGLGVDIEYTGSVPFEEWIPAVSQIHTGVAPLEDTLFNTAKSSLKPLELAVAKVPFVCSPTREYLHLGAGLFAGKPKEWERQLRRLLIDPVLRAEEVERNYEIAQKWALKDHVDLWRDAWMN